LRDILRLMVALRSGPCPRRTGGFRRMRDYGTTGHGV